MQYAIIENDMIVNIAEADEPLAENWEPLPEGVGRGWVRSGPGQPWQLPALPEPAQEPVPEEVPRWQCIRALRLTADPNAPERTCLETVQMLRDAMDPGEMRDDVDDALNNVLNWRRASPTLAAMAAFAGWSAEFVDQLFRAAFSYEL